MSATIINNGDGTFALKLEYTAETTRVNQTLDAAVHELWDRGLGEHTKPNPDDPDGKPIPVTYDELTNQQKLRILDRYILRVMRDLARHYYIKAARDAVRTTAEQEADNNFIPPDVE